MQMRALLAAKNAHLQPEQREHLIDATQTQPTIETPMRPSAPQVHGTAPEGATRADMSHALLQPPMAPPRAPYSPSVTAANIRALLRR
jgi:hypothetical protein